MKTTIELTRLLRVSAVCLVAVIVVYSWAVRHPAVASGKIWYVSTTGSDTTGNGSVAAPFATIQHGVEVARDNDTVIVYPGTYVENVHIWGGAPPQPQVIIKSQAGPATTIIDGNHLDSVITVEAGTVTIEGFTIQNGGGTGLASAGYGIVVYPYWATNMVVIRNNVIKNNHGKAGIGIRGTSGSLIENNLIVSNAGGIDLDVSSTSAGQSIIRNNVIAFNQSTIGGVNVFACCGSTLHVDIINNTIISNTAVYGGGVRLAAASARLANNIIALNMAIYAGDDLYGISPGVSIEYNDVGDGQLAGTNGNISSPPLLADPVNGNFHLTANSQCINAGTSINVPATDFEGNSRPYGSGVDIGADEFIWATDGLPPVSYAESPATHDGTFTVTWQGTDQGGSGLDYFDVQVKDGANGSWVNWLTHTHNLQAAYDGILGHTYYFQVRAVDHAGNVEPYPGGNGDTVTFIGPDLTSSSKRVAFSPADLSIGSVLTYTIVVRNTQSVDASARLTDTLPAYTRYVTDSLTSSAEPANFNSGLGDNGTIVWNGSVSAAQPVTIAFEVELLPDAPANLPIRNTVFINDGWEHVLSRRVFAPSHDAYLPLVMRDH